MSQRPSHPSLAKSALMFSALGVVYGDIGTSPLYTLRECFHAAGITPDASSIMGILSLIVWSLLLVVTLKYITFVLRADNKGEGGILALTAQALQKQSEGGNVLCASPVRRMIVLLIGLSGAALFYGDAIITPAISVLGAMEGLHVINPAFDAWVVPMAMALLVGLFSFQRFGTGTVGQWFGPVMLLWFGTLGMLGLNQIILHPGILDAFNPLHGLNFLLTYKLAGFLTLGTVVLAVTGAEALYADLGHFGRTPICRAWLFIAGPGLLLNYFGQGALLLANPETLVNPFYLLAPDELRLPLIFLAMAATIIASQSVITGAYSLTQQAMQLGYLPRFEVRHTSAHHIGQVYLPALNAALLLGVLLLVLTFKNSSNLAAAYGIAVTGTMAATTLLATAVLYQRFRWPLWGVVLFGSGFLIIDLLFFTANLHKIPHGGWLPLLLGGGLLFAMYTWMRGREATFRQIYAKTGKLTSFIDNVPALRKAGLHRPDRAAVYLTSNLDVVPLALSYNVEHNQTLHAEVVLIKVSRSASPRVAPRERLTLTALPHGFYTLEISYGFMETPNIPAALNDASEHHDLPFSARTQTSYFLSRHAYVPVTRKLPEKHDLNLLQEPVYMLMESLSQSAIRFFRLPLRQVVEIGDHLPI